MNTTLRGCLQMILAVTIFTVMSALIKAADRVPAGQAVFFRSFFAIPVILVWLLTQGALGTGLRTKNWRSHAVRGIAGSSAMGLGFLGLKFLPLPEVTALRFVTPIMMVVLAALILGERLRIIRISAVLIGLVGVIVIMWPRLSFEGTQTETIGVFVVLASAGLAALAQVFIKGMAETEKTTAIVFYFSLTATVLSLFSLPFGWVLPTGQEWVYLIGAGVIGGFGQICLTSSYKYADASVLAPFTYVSMIWALLIGYFVFAEVPTVPMLAGAALIIASGVVIVLRERQLGLQQTARRKLRSME